MLEFVFPIFIGVVGMMLGVKIGFEYLANDFYTQGRIKPEERSYIASMEYFWKSFNIFGDDK